MNCIKTGFHAYCHTTQEFVYGDAFQTDYNGLALEPLYFIFRCCGKSSKPINGLQHIHFGIITYEEWWDHDKTCQAQSSTMLAKWSNIVYNDGKEIDIDMYLRNER